MNIVKLGNLLMYMLAGMLMYSCSGEDIIPAPDGLKQETTLSILLNGSQDGELKSSGNPDIDAESKIYSLEVLIFKSSDEPEAGKLDGYGCITRTTRTVAGQTYDKEFVEIDEIKKIKLTAGKRDIYVIANAPDNFFSSVTNIQEFRSLYEDLSTQGRCPHPGTVTPNTDENLPIGGINPSDWKTNLTMCNYLENVEFNNRYDQHYLGYTDNEGRPTGVNPTDGFLLNDRNPFLVERLVARVAIGSIKFVLPSSLPFEGTTYSSKEYTFHIDSVFMMNVKTKSKFAVDTDAPAPPEKFGHGCDVGYSFLNSAGRINDLNQQSQRVDFLAEAISTPNYDITTTSPLWFYAFENQDSSLPTYLVIGVRYNFRSTKDGSIRTVKSYYPIKVNQPEGGKIAGHDYIKRNYQYQIDVTIKGLGNMYGNNSVPLKNLQTANPDIEIKETVGQNLFPWTGDVYR